MLTARTVFHFVAWHDPRTALLDSSDSSEFLAELSVMFFGLRWDLFVFADVQRTKMNNLFFPLYFFLKLPLLNAPNWPVIKRSQTNKAAAAAHHMLVVSLTYSLFCRCEKESRMENQVWRKKKEPEPIDVCEYCSSAWWDSGGEALTSQRDAQPSPSVANLPLYSGGLTSVESMNDTWMIIFATVWPVEPWALRTLWQVAFSIKIQITCAISFIFNWTHRTFL